MKKLLLSILLTSVTLFANYAKNETCKGCHTLIYDEFYDSLHRKSSIYEDSIHQAAWNNHPDKQNKSYTCAKCHTPTDLKLLDNLKNNKTALPSKNKEQIQEAISCAFCHSIKNIKEHEGMSTNEMSTQKKFFYSANNEKKDLSEVKYEDDTSLFGMVKEKKGSPFHKIDYTNKNYYNANMCMGCHAELKNSQNVELFKIKKASAKDEKTNCITCHMPKVKGSMSNIEITDKHRYHGFAGAHNKSGLLEKYVKFSFNQKANGFDIGIKNEASHDLFLQPLRVAILKVSIIRDGKTIELQEHQFEKTYKKEDTLSSHWLANKVQKNSMIHANEKVNIAFDTPVIPKDRVKVILGFYLVKPSMIEELKLQNNKTATKFNTLKQQLFDIKQ